ncbi:hypothetical protein B0H17DRAFT_1187078 [Mycena rosella]|uniref:Uncharacterized protein n=1 Tax=Mycena rosella TaxID=1033263 RepID=A0AAD7C9S5_MYCRO|nr:hypothetical protein B0H17DRAFT_1187078 [Mycena rosella]
MIMAVNKEEFEFEVGISKGFPQPSRTLAILTPPSVFAHIWNARPGIRFQYKGRVSAADVARRKRTGRVRIMSDGGAKQPRPGIRFQYTGRVSAAHVARRVHPGRIMSDGGARQPRITSDGGPKQPRYGIRFKCTGQASGAHVDHV